MSNTDTNTPSRQKASERLFIDADGNEVDKIELATGARYVIPANGKSFDMQLGKAGDPNTMFAVFGYHTKLGNVANTIRNDKTAPGRPDDEADAIEEFLESVSGGAWREPSEGGRGPKYDDSILAAVLCDIAHKQGKTDRTPDMMLEKLKDKKFRATMLAGEVGGIRIKDAYAQEAERRGITKPAARDVTDAL